LVGTGPYRRDSHRLWEFDWLRLPSYAFVASSMSLFSQWHHRLGRLCGSRLSVLLFHHFYRWFFLPHMELLYETS
jgi:hypothetical protein